MNVYKEVIAHEVFPAMGCTEPISLAYAGSIAAEGIEEPFEKISFVVNQGTYKNGLAVTVPNTGGRKGNLIAGTLGCIIGDPSKKMEILSKVTEEQLALAGRLIEEKRASIKVHPRCTTFYVKVDMETAHHRSTCIIAGSHTNVVYLERDGRVLIDEKGNSCEHSHAPYKDELSKLSIDDLITLAEAIDEEDMRYLSEGVAMNLALSQEGVHIKKVGSYLLDLLTKGFLQNDVFSSTKILTSCAVDARMDGMAKPAMASGGSGNQGIVATLVPYNVGKHFSIDERTILKSIALSHLLNAYVKVFIGELAPICGCAIAAGIGATAALVYQKNGRDLEGITTAINNMVSDIGGMICDGAKSGCAFKVVSSTDAAIRAAYLGIHHYGIDGLEGFVGHTAEETIRNLTRITEIGMEHMDETIVDIMKEKDRGKK
ncbi:MAG: L-serine ammonia-lyase, iron-sulfur-dependent, subunit alpha [Candidatus Eremiobacteraeota bacterium]|nr:L-serine ammonia-lyase, iron-sulfur-dependent, subunit alpha [Candidatus Eremiobacteraeota bacterium]